MKDLQKLKYFTFGQAEYEKIKQAVFSPSAYRPYCLYVPR